MILLSAQKIATKTTAKKLKGSRPPSGSKRADGGRFEVILEEIRLKSQEKIKNSGPECVYTVVPQVGPTEHNVTEDL